MNERDRGRFFMLTKQGAGEQLVEDGIPDIQSCSEQGLSDDAERGNPQCKDVKPSRDWRRERSQRIREDKW